MTKAVYIVGGAGVGKSTFMHRLLKDISYAMGPLEDIHAHPNARGTVVTLRGHHLGPDGLYLGAMRNAYPGTDGLDRASSATGRHWLETGAHRRFKFIVAEGATLATRPFLGALKQETSLLFVHLVAPEAVQRARLLDRAIEMEIALQDPQWVRTTVTKSSNIAEEMEEDGVPVLRIDTSEMQAWEFGLMAVLDHCGVSSPRG